MSLLIKLAFISFIAVSCGELPQDSRIGRSDYRTHDANMGLGNNKAPIVLAHGLLGSDGLFRLGRLEKEFRQRGFPVYLTEVSAVNSIEYRAHQLAGQVDEIYSQNNGCKVHIVAHSMGGLDSRFLISGMGYEGIVSSLTTISTPHQGSPVADEIVEEAGHGRILRAVKLVGMFASLYNQSTRISDADLLTAVENLTTEHMQNFNQSYPNHRGVTYFSAGAATDRRRTHLVLRGGYDSISSEAGVNDGLVPVESSRWGEYIGTFRADHLTVAGLGTWIRRRHFDLSDLVDQITDRLDTLPIECRN